MNEENDAKVNEEQVMKWYQKTWFIVLMLILFFPIGAVLLYTSREHHPKWKILMGVFGVLFVLGLIGNMSKDDSTSSSKPAVTQTQSTTNSSKPSSKPAAKPKQEEPSVPREYKNALNKADQYVKRMHMSKAAVYDQLTSEYGEKFSAEAADYAVSHLNADYKKAALEKAKTYQNQMNMSRDAIYDQLISPYGEQFTEEEADYAIEHLPQ